MNEHFSYDDRLGIYIPDLKWEWDEYSEEIQHYILLHWENIRGSIPDRIAEIEKMINLKQEQLNNEDDFPRSCELNSEIAELASVINDLWLWFRANQTLSGKMHQ